MTPVPQKNNDKRKIVQKRLSAAFKDLASTIRWNYSVRSVTKETDGSIFALATLQRQKS